MYKEVIPWPEEGMTVADLVKLLQTLPPTYKVIPFVTYGKQEIEIDDEAEQIGIGTNP